MTISITKRYTRLIPCSLLSDCKNVQKPALKKCKRAKNWIIDFADFLFLTVVIFADFCLFCVPPLSLGVTLVTLKQKVFALIISNLYLKIIHSASENSV